MDQNVKFVLASQSPRRIQLLKMIGIDAEVHPSTLEEVVNTTVPDELVKSLAHQKVRDVATFYQGTKGRESSHSTKDLVLIGADTIVSIDGKILGKPKSEEDAFLTLRELSGRTHEVYTGVCILRLGEKDDEKSFVEETKVEICEMEDSEILDYIRSGDPMDKAGSYGIQGEFAKYVRGIRGDYYNVMGLPLARLYQELKDF